MNDARLGQFEFPHLDDGLATRHLVMIHDTDVELLSRRDVRVPGLGVFISTSADRRVERAAVLAWRDEVNEFVRERLDFPVKMSRSRQADFDVELGLRLLNDTREIEQFEHPAFWCWLATEVFPHLVVHRWGWPSLSDEGAAPTSKRAWRRFNTSLRNGLRLTVYRVGVLGEDIARRCDEQEFQDILERPAFGNDPRVARIILAGLADAFDERATTGYGLGGSDGPSRTDHAKRVAVLLRVWNAMRPLCFLPDEEIARLTLDAISETLHVWKADADESPATGSR